MSNVTVVEFRPVKCPRCGKLAELFEKDAPVGFRNPKRCDIYGCDTCEVPEYDGLDDSVYYRQFIFLADGSEVI